MGTIAFKNQDQLVLWKTEIRGQVSDGYWENARPWNHWEKWCRAEAIVDAQNFGIDFYPSRTAYNLTAPELLEVVGDRMRYRVALTRRFGHEKVLSMKSRPPESDSEWNDTADYMKESQEEWRAAGLSPLGSDGIGMKELRAILTAMKKVMRARREEKKVSPDSDSAPPNC